MNSKGSHKPAHTAVINYFSSLYIIPFLQSNRIGNPNIFYLYEAFGCILVNLTAYFPANWYITNHLILNIHFVCMQVCLYQCLLLHQQMATMLLQKRKLLYVLLWCACKTNQCLRIREASHSVKQNE